jgi:hypothetical protein
MQRHIAHKPSFDPPVHGAIQAINCHQYHTKARSSLRAYTVENNVADAWQWRFGWNVESNSKRLHQARIDGQNRRAMREDCTKLHANQSTMQSIFGCTLNKLSIAKLVASDCSCKSYLMFTNDWLAFVNCLFQWVLIDCFQQLQASAIGLLGCQNLIQYLGSSTCIM